MSEVLKMANDSKTEEVVILLDCCHAGNLGNPPVVNNARAMLREGISILTASRGDQVSVEASGAGLFSSLVADALAGGAADVLGDVTAPAIYAFVEGALGAWDQRPLFKSHVSKMGSVRGVLPRFLRSRAAHRAFSARPPLTLPGRWLRKGPRPGKTGHFDGKTARTRPENAANSKMQIRRRSCDPARFADLISGTRRGSAAIT